jgi:hypothetical protein
MPDAPQPLSDAEIFAKVSEWDRTSPPVTAHEFIGISEQELRAWEQRTQIFVGREGIEPDPNAVERGYEWSAERLSDSVNRKRPS